MPEETERLYAMPQHVTNLDECWFYHTMDIPGYGVVQGGWDLRGMERAYLGNVDFRNKRVLEVGPASGFFSFYMERQGAEVVCIDIGEGEPRDAAPFAGKQPEQRSSGLGWTRRRDNAFWFAHRMFNSNVRVVYGNVYKVPQTIGPVQIATFGNVLLHLRDPFLALQQVLPLATETVIVTETISGRFLTPVPRFLRGLRFLGNLAKRGNWSIKLYNRLAKESMLFLPRSSAELTPGAMLWGLTPGIVRRFVEVLGFRDTAVSYHTQRYRGDWIPQFTVVGRRANTT